MALIYYAIYPSAAGTPSAAQIKAGQQASGAAASAAGSQAEAEVDGYQDWISLATGLTAGTSYRIAFVHADGGDVDVVESAAWSTVAVWEYTPAGGVISGAAAPVARGWEFGAAGGVNSGGVSVVVSEVIALASSGAQTAGVAQVLRVAQLVASGLLSVSGAAQAAAVRAFTGIGGAATSGALTPARLWVCASAGGVSGGGSVAVCTAYAFATSGGAITGGTASTEQAGANSYTAQGGAVTGGGAALARTWVDVAVGGTQSSGAAQVSLETPGDSQYLGAGGAVAAGQAGVAIVHASAGTGGVATSGSASVATASVWAHVGSAGARIGGAAPVAVVRVISGAGGTSTGGSGVAPPRTLAAGLQRTYFARLRIRNLIGCQRVRRAVAGVGMNSTTFDPMRPDEIEVFAVDFKRRLGLGATISLASVVAVLAEDANEAPIPSMTSGPATIDGVVVSQMIAGISEGHYTLLFRVTSSQGEVLIEARDLTVQRRLA